MELKIISAKGNIKDVRAIGYVEKDENNLSEYIYGTFQDITKQKKIEKELIDAKEKTDEDKERLKFVLEGSKLGYWDWNIETNEVQRNERWAEILGYTLEEIKFSVKTLS